MKKKLLFLSLCLFETVSFSMERPDNKQTRIRTTRALCAATSCVTVALLLSNKGNTLDRVMLATGAIGSGLVLYGIRNE